MFTDEYGNPMDPVQWFIEQQSRNATPEWSISKQAFQPVDIGTLISNSKYQNNMVGDDHYAAALRGVLDQSMFESTWEEPERPEMPERPSAPLLGQYRASMDPVQQALLAAVESNVDPRRAVMSLIDEKFLDAPNGDNTEFDYYMKEADALRRELYDTEQWQQQTEQLQSQSDAMEPTEILSPMAQKWKDDGYFYQPHDEFTPEMVDSGMRGQVEEAEGLQSKYDTSAAAYEEAVRSWYAQNKARKVGGRAGDTVADSMGRERLRGLQERNTPAPKQIRNQLEEVLGGWGFGGKGLDGDEAPSPVRPSSNESRSPGLKDVGALARWVGRGLDVSVGRIGEGEEGAKMPYPRLSFDRGRANAGGGGQGGRNGRGRGTWGSMRDAGSQMRQRGERAVLNKRPTREQYGANNANEVAQKGFQADMRRIDAEIAARRMRQQFGTPWQSEFFGRAGL